MIFLIMARLKLASFLISLHILAVNPVNAVRHISSINFPPRGRPTPIIDECVKRVQLPPPLNFANLPKEYFTCAQDLREAQEQFHPLVGLKTDEIIRYHGYPVEVHNVTTEDGYILKLHRIPSNRASSTSVLIMHGVAASSDNWVANGKEQSLPFVLADLGYDVWLGNNRGTTYTLDHVSLSSDDIKFWDFSWHELGIYDLPAFVNFIKEKNGRRKMFYIGHSQGGSQYYVGASTSPASSVINKDNIIAAFLLSPAGFAGWGTYPTTAMALQVGTGVEWDQYNMLGGRIDSPDKMEAFSEALSSVYGYACLPIAALCGACSHFLFSVAGFNAPQMNYTNVPLMVNKFPNILGLKSMIHYGQDIRDCSFHQFDYGLEENRRRYGSSTPPDYHLENINIPTYFFYGDMDYAAFEEDILKAASYFRKESRKDIIRVNSDYFNHFDFFFAKNAKELVYNHITERMQKELSVDPNTIQAGSNDGSSSFNREIRLFSHYIIFMLRSNLLNKQKTTLMITK